MNWSIMSQIEKNSDKIKKDTETPIWEQMSTVFPAWPDSWPYIYIYGHESGQAGKTVDICSQIGVSVSFLILSEFFSIWLIILQFTLISLI